MTPRIAVLDDEPRMAEILAMVLRRDGYEVSVHTAPEQFVSAFENDPADLVMTDLKMPKMDGVEVLKRVRALAPDVPVILVTAHATVATAIEAMREGAFDYVEKPFDNNACRTLVQKALQFSQLARENRYMRQELKSRYAFDNLVMASKPMQQVLDLTQRAARGRATVLISGESGTGKELIARAIHYYSDRVGRPFLAVNTRAFASGVLESELFGHEKGAFTGAEHARSGVFERANGGTLFLDEIGEIDGGFQAKLLRVLQEREVLRVGSNEPRKVDVRLVCATNRDLRAEVAAGNFREDLFFRIAVIPIHLPPLRERRDDILPLARHFLQRFALEMGRDGADWNSDVEQWLVQHDWPGNVRELENTVERAVVLMREDTITLEDLLLPASTASAQRPDNLNAHLDIAAKEHIRQILQECGGVRVDAARRLGIERTTLYRLIKKFKLDSSI